MQSVVTSRLTQCFANIFRPAIRAAVVLAVFSTLLVIAVHPAQAQTEEVLYNFAGTPDGANPYAGLVLHNGNLFGTTYDGGLYGFGTVFELAPTGKGTWKETVLL